MENLNFPVWYHKLSASMGQLPKKEKERWESQLVSTILGPRVPYGAPTGLGGAPTGPGKAATGPGGAPSCATEIVFNFAEKMLICLS